MSTHPPSAAPLERLRAPWHRYWLAAAILLASLGLKLVLAWFARDMECMGDECSFIEHARKVVDQGASALMDHRFSRHRAPGQPLFVALCAVLFSNPRLAAGVIGSIASTATAAIVAKTAENAYGVRAGLITLILVAFYPTLAFFSHTMWTETNYLLFFSAAILVLTARAPLTPAGAAGSGLLFGAATMFKPVSIYFLPVAIAWALATRRVSPRNCLLLAACAFMLVLPWSARNWIVYERFVLVGSSLGINMQLGLQAHQPGNKDWKPPVVRRVIERSTALPPDNPALRMKKSTRGRLPAPEHYVDRDRGMARSALAQMLENPRRTLWLSWIKWADLVSPTSFLTRHVRERVAPYRFRKRTVERINRLVAASWIFVALAGLAGLVLRTGKERWLFLALVAYPLVLAAATFGMSRFRLPMVPYLAIGAGAALDGLIRAAPLLREHGRRALTRDVLLRTAVLAVLVTGLVSLWAARWRWVFWAG